MSGLKQTIRGGLSRFISPARIGRSPFVGGIGAILSCITCAAAARSLPAQPHLEVTPRFLPAWSLLGRSSIDVITSKKCIAA
jgi:hypothetical protein